MTTILRPRGQYASGEGRVCCPGLPPRPGGGRGSLPRGRIPHRISEGVPRITAHRAKLTVPIPGEEKRLCAPVFANHAGRGQEWL